jgi:hypothetical protein
MGWVLALLLLRVSFRLPLRQTVGMAESLIKLRGSKAQVPSRSTLCRRAQEIGESAALSHAALFLRSSLEEAKKSGGKVTLLVDSTGLSIRGPGSWRTDKPGAHERQRRAYVKLHLAVDLNTQQVVAVRTGFWKQGDAEVLPDLLEAVPAGVEVEALCADGAYDTRGVYAAAEKRGIEDVRIPPSTRARPWKESVPGARLRNRHFEQGGRSKSFVAGGKAWAEAVGYHARSLMETTMSRLTALGAHRLRSRSTAGREAEALLALEVLNHHARLGLPERPRAWA